MRQATAQIVAQPDLEAGVINILQGEIKPLASRLENRGTRIQNAMYLLDKLGIKFTAEQEAIAHEAIDCSYRAARYLRKSAGLPE